MRFLVAGCGYVGRRLAELLASIEGGEVFALSRSGTIAIPNVTPIKCDLVAGDLGHLPQALDRIFYCAAPDDASVEAYRNIYQVGLERLVNVADRSNGRQCRLLMTSSTSVYGQSHGESVDENSPTEPASPTAKLIVAGEKLLRSVDTSVRLAGIYGPGRVSFVNAAKSGAIKVNQVASSYTNRIHREDAAAILKFCSELKDPMAIVNGVDRVTATRAEVASWLAEQLGVELARTDKNEESSFLRGNKKVSSQRLVDAGYKFIYPSYREGYGELIRSGLA